MTEMEGHIRRERFGLGVMKTRGRLEIVFQEKASQNSLDVIWYIYYFEFDTRNASKHPRNVLPET